MRSKKNIYCTGIEWDITTILLQNESLDIHPEIYVMVYIAVNKLSN